MEKELKIEIPEGYEIDKEKSTFEKIVFKKKQEEEYPRFEQTYQNYMFAHVNDKQMVEDLLFLKNVTNWYNEVDITRNNLNPSSKFTCGVYVSGDGDYALTDFVSKAQFKFYTLSAAKAFKNNCKYELCQFSKRLYRNKN